MAALQVEVLQLSKANLSGLLPPLSGLLQLREAYLDGNEFVGTVPATLPDALEVLILAGNRLNGSVPLFVTVSAQPSRLRRLDISDNALVGTLPGGLSSLLNLATIRLQGNRLNGSLPAGVSCGAGCGHVDIGMFRRMLLAPVAP